MKVWPEIDHEITQLAISILNHDLSPASIIN